MSDSYPLVFPYIGSFTPGGSEAYTGIGPSYDFDSTGATSIIVHLLGSCSGLDAAKSITFRVRVGNDEGVAYTSRTLLGTLPTVGANGLFSVAVTVTPPAGAQQWAITAQTDSVGTPSISEASLVLEVVRGTSSPSPALLAVGQSAGHIFVAGSSESFGDGMGAIPFSPEIDFGKLGSKFQLIFGATTGDGGTAGHLRVRIGGTYNIIDGTLAVDLPVSASPFHVWAARAVIDNIWSTPLPLKVTGMNGFSAIGPTLAILPW